VPYAVLLKRLVLVLVFVGRALPALGGEELSGPLAVVPLYESAEKGPLAWAAQTMSEHLQSLGGLEVVGADRLVEMLSGGVKTKVEAVSLERMKGLFQQGYLQSYSFEYEKALEIFGRLLAGLDQLPFSEERWQLWIKAKIFEGICLMGLERVSEALQALSAVLRTRPGFTLDRREYSPGTINLWEQARKNLSQAQRGELLVESDPAGAEIFLDGIKIGDTPYQGRWPYGIYHLYISHPGQGSAARRVEIGAQPVRVRLIMAFEGALELDVAHPGIKSPQPGKPLPQHWWPWLGERLGLKRLIVLMRRPQAEGVLLGGALMDLERGSRLREGWLELPAEMPERVRTAVAELAAFLVTGKASPNLQVTHAEKVAPQAPVKKEVPSVRPAKYKFVSWALGAGGALCGAIIAHSLASYYKERIDDYVTTAGQQKMRDNYHAWLGVGIVFDVVAAGLLVTGIVMHQTYHPADAEQTSWLLPAAVPGGMVLTWSASF